MKLFELLFLVWRFAPTKRPSVSNLTFSLFSLVCCLLLHYYWPCPMSVFSFIFRNTALEINVRFSVANLAGFPRIWTCFYVELRDFLKTCGLLVFGLVLMEIGSFFWACFLQISVLWIAFFSNVMTLCLFYFTAKANLGVFLISALISLFPLF